jgi:hypothetical protein
MVHMKHRYAVFIAILNNTQLKRLFALDSLGLPDMPDDVLLGLATITKNPGNNIAKKWTYLNGSQVFQTFSCLRKAKKRAHELIRHEREKNNSDNFSFALRIDV